MTTVTDLVAELRTFRERFKAAHGEAQVEALCDLEDIPATALHKTPARSLAELRLKLDVLSDFVESTWSDRRDIRLIESIKADLRRLIDGGAS